MPKLNREYLFFCLHVLKGKSQRREFLFYGENNLNAVRVDLWELHLALKNSWLGSGKVLDGGLLIDIKLDPFQRSPETGGHLRWMKEKTYILPVMMPQLLKFQKSLKDFPPGRCRYSVRGP